MEGNQKIKCTVESCKYNNQEQNMCTLPKIEVRPVNNCNTENSDETLCSSYDYEKE